MRVPMFVTRTVVSAVMLVMTSQAFAQSATVNGIDFVGLNRVTPESLQAILPIAIGEPMTDEAIAQSIQNLYQSEQFSNVQVQVVDARITFYVVERPVIAELNFEGNKLIPKAGLEEGLKQIGLAVGGVLKQATVHHIETELENQYISQGYYNSDIEIRQTMLEGNRVRLDIHFVEGKPAKVVNINVLGNQHFSDEDIKDIMVLKQSNWNKFSKSDRYTQEKFAQSLEALKNAYLNEGFARFNIDESILNISEDKRSIYIELKVSEGERYQFGQSRFVGRPTYETDKLNELIAYRPKMQYSQKLLNQTTEAVANKFGNDGYYYAQIRPMPRINDETRIVDIDYHIDPVRPIYVRRINFSGNIKTKDEVLRREMRQLEGALASNQKIQLSQARLMRTGYFKNVVVEAVPVTASPDQIDLNVNVEEQPSGSSTIAAGYSQSGGVTFQLDLSQNNFMGTGNRVNVAFSRSETQDSYNLGITNPYFTKDGVSQSVNAYYRKTKYDDKLISDYVMDSFGGGLTYGYPIDENQRISAGLNMDSTQVRGGRWMAIANVKQLMDDGGKGDFSDTPSFKNKYTSYNALLGWSYSSLDKGVFPTKGMTHEMDLTLGLGKQAYQKLTYRANVYYPFFKGTTLRAYARLGYGNNLPFYENFYAGGYGSVRGYGASTLGPRSPAYDYVAKGSKDTNGVYVASGNSLILGENIGGNALATFGTEMILPVPFKGDWADQVRPVLFVEGGQVFNTRGVSDKTIDIRSIDQNSSLSDEAAKTRLMSKDNDLRFSAGVGLTWYTPIGPLSLSYAQPINHKKDDKVERLQFQIGSVF